MQKITNTIIAPIKVIYDKTYEYVLKYIIKYFDYDDIQIERLYQRHSTYQQVLSFFREPTHIIDNIYLGNARNAASFYDLKEKNIKLIINVTTEISEYYPQNFIYIKYDLYDNNKDSIKNFLKDSYIKIKEFQEINKNRNILIHCFMGSSRSASILIYYIIKTLKKDNGESYNLDEAIEFIKTKREIINPSKKFIAELKEIILEDLL
jgi:protein-tyrosine phosphatase